MKEAKRSSEVNNQPRRKFDVTFKRDAVAHWLSSGKSAQETASELGIRDKQLYLWKQKFAPRTPATQGQMEEELATLRRENVQLRQRCDILKKTLGILSEPAKSASNGSML